MPTNDINEGALGSFRVMMRRQPQLSLTGYNAQAMYFHNDTAAFVSKFFVEPEDLKFVHSMAQEGAGKDKMRQREIIEHTRQRVAEKEDRRVKRKKKEEEKKSRIGGLILLCDKEQLPKIKEDNLKDMLDRFKQAGAPKLDHLKRSSLVGEIQKGLYDAIVGLENGEWMDPMDEEDTESDDTETDNVLEISIDDEDSDWALTDSEDNL